MSDEFILAVVIVIVIFIAVYGSKRKPRVSITSDNNKNPSEQILESSHIEDNEEAAKIPKPQKTKLNEETKRSFPKQKHEIQICRTISNSSKPVFILGKAGTGKSTIINLLRKLPEFKNNVGLVPV